MQRLGIWSFKLSKSTKLIVLDNDFHFSLFVETMSLVKFWKKATAPKADPTMVNIFIICSIYKKFDLIAPNVGIGAVRELMLCPPGANAN